MAVLTSTDNLSAKKSKIYKNVRIFSLKIVIFTAVKISVCCIDVFIKCNEYVDLNLAHHKDRFFS